MEPKEKHGSGGHLTQALAPGRDRLDLNHSWQTLLEDDLQNVLSQSHGYSLLLVPMHWPYSSARFQSCFSPLLHEWGKTITERRAATLWVPFWGRNACDRRARTTGSHSWKEHPQAKTWELRLNPFRLQILSSKAPSLLSTIHLLLIHQKPNQPKALKAFRLSPQNLHCSRGQWSNF